MVNLDFEFSSSTVYTWTSGILAKEAIGGEARWLNDQMDQSIEFHVNNMNLHDNTE